MVLGAVVYGHQTVVAWPLMPFQSKAQRAFMFANHPDVAKRWEALTPKGVELPEKKSSEESPSPKIQRLPRRSGPKRDFRSLSPGQFSRHPGKGSEKESMEEWGTEAHFPDGRKEKMGLGSKNVLDRFAERDVKRAARRP